MRVSTTISGLISVLCCHFVAASSPNALASFILESAGNKVYLDLNRDGAADQINSYSGRVLIRKQRDRNFDKKFDWDSQRSVVVKKGRPFKRITIDNNFDNKTDRLENYYQTPNLKNERVEIHVDSDYDGKFDFSYQQLIKTVQHKHYPPCDQKFQKLAVTLKKLDRQVKKISLVLDKGGDFFSTDFGFKIDSSCFDKWGKEEFLSLVQDSLKKGLQCLMQLDETHRSEKKAGVSGALQNAVDLQLLMDKNPIQLVCSEKNYNWKKAVAHGSTGAGQVLEELGISHPFVSINPNTAKLPSNLKTTLFHEYFHNLGHRHGKDIEYAYTCEDCCFKNLPEKSQRKAEACKVCRGSYRGVSDREYLNDLSKWSRLAGDGKRGYKALVNFLKDHPESRWGILKLAEHTSHAGGIVGIQMARILRKRLKNKSQPEASLIREALRNLSVVKKEKTKEATIVANVVIALYLDQDVDKALSVIEENIKPLKAVVKNAQKSNPPASKQTLEVYHRLRNSLDDLFINQYSGTVPFGSSPKNYSDQVFNLMVELGYPIWI
ncbi:MAG: hypothetical protein HOM21_11795 [Halobacteriovoraceae bacterium]|nr:hypothetical protein [Halobacteriovoraceae bacterium]